MWLYYFNGHLLLCAFLLMHYSLFTLYLLFSSVHLHLTLCDTPWPAACQASLSIINSLSLLKLMSIELVMSFNHLKD